MTEALVSLDPDVIILTEYVHGPFRLEFLTELKEHDFAYRLVSECRAGENHVLIASRTALEAGTIRPPENIDHSVPSNALHARLPHQGIDILGLRIPDYSKDPPTKRACWDWVLETAKCIKDRPSVLIGDFNTDPKYPKSKCGDRIGRLIEDGWQIASPTDGASHWSLNGHAVRIDHAFVTRHFVIAAADYIWERNGHVFAGKKPGALSDHAVLSIDIRRVLPMTTDSTEVLPLPSE
jgi:hypothetical protein